MTEIEVLKLALEALRKARRKVLTTEECHAVIMSIKEALREHAMYEVQRLGQEIQPEQEPVAFASHGVINWIADKQFEHEADLYTTPPQRTWVGLTAKETSDFVDQYWANDAVSMKELIGFVEAKLKEKNT